MSEDTPPPSPPADVLPHGSTPPVSQPPLYRPSPPLLPTLGAPPPSWPASAPPTTSAPPATTPPTWGAPPPVPPAPPTPSTWGAPPPMPPPGTHWSDPPPQRRGRRGLWVALVLVGVLIGLLVVAGVGLVYWQANRGPDHPDEWDPRVVDLVDFVEQQRGESFEHPVAVNFMSAEDYSAATGGVDVEPSDEDRQAAEDQAGLYRALGLMSGPVDLIDSSNDLFEDGTAAYYDSITEQVYVNAESSDGTISPATAVTVVHELTHALQDQLVDLDGIDTGEDGPTTDWSDAHLAVVEGDAMVVEQAYIAQLSDEDFDAYSSEWDALVDDSDQAMADNEVPAALDVFFGLPYVFGPSWILAAQAEDAQDRIDAAIGGDVPPSVAILNLEVEDHDAREPTAAVVPEDAEELYTDRFGGMSWLVVLGEHNEPDLAIDAASTWAGDEMVVFRDQRDRVCFHAAVDVGRGGSAVDGPLFEAATAWADALPQESLAGVTVQDSEVQFSACDPGTDVEIPLTGQAQAAVDRWGLHNAIVTSVLTEGDVDLDRAACYADGLIEQFGVERLNEDEDLVVSSEFSRAAATVAESCGVGG